MMGVAPIAIPRWTRAGTTRFPTAKPSSRRRHAPSGHRLAPSAVDQAHDENGRKISRRDRHETAVDTVSAEILTGRPTNQKARCRRDSEINGAPTGVR